MLLIESGNFPRFLVPFRVFVFSCGLLKISAVLLIESGKFPRFLVPFRVFVFSCGLSFSTVEFIKETPIFFFDRVLIT